MTHLAVRGLRKSYEGRDVIAGIDFELTPGECFGLLGPNGAGKTTTLRLVLGLTQPDAGSAMAARAARTSSGRIGFGSLDIGVERA